MKSKRSPYSSFCITRRDGPVGSEFTCDSQICGPKVPTRSHSFIGPNALLSGFGTTPVSRTVPSQTTPASEDGFAYPSVLSQCLPSIYCTRCLGLGTKDSETPTTGPCLRLTPIWSLLETPACRYGFQEKNLKIHETVKNTQNQRRKQWNTSLSWFCLFCDL